MTAMLVLAVVNLALTVGTITLAVLILTSPAFRTNGRHLNKATSK